MTELSEPQTSSSSHGQIEMSILFDTMSCLPYIADVKHS